MVSSASKVHVAVRVRPSTKSERNSGNNDPINISSKDGKISVLKESQLRDKCFLFDKVYDSNVSQNEVYEDLSNPILNYFLNGYNTTVSLRFYSLLSLGF